MIRNLKIHPVSTTINPIYNNYILVNNKFVFTDYFLHNIKTKSDDYKKNMKFIDIVNILRKEFDINGNIRDVIIISCSKCNINNNNEGLVSLAKKCIISI